PQIDEASVRREPGVPVVNQPVRVTATILPGGNNQLTEVVILYQLNGGEEQIVNMERVEGDVWGGSIPGQSEGTTVWYRIRATNSAGLTSYVPFRNWRFAYTVRPEGGLKIRDIQYRPAQWDVDYSPYRGYEVTVTGIVTTPASFAQVYGGYAIQDTADEWSGVIVRGIQDNLNVGDSIRVTGIVYERDPANPQKWEFATYIQVSRYEVLGQATPIRPILVRGVSDLTFSRRAENLEACLVRLIDFEIDTLDGLDLATTLYWPLEDQTGDGGWMTAIGLTQEQIRDMGLRELRQGSRITSAIGVFTENYGHYAMALRGPQDLGPVEVREIGTPTPYRFVLHPVYPNPFNARASVSFDLAQSGFARLALYDLNGSLVSDLIQADFKAGRHTLVLDGANLPTGVYVLRLESAGGFQTRKVALVR
ncbi:MAG: T9SS type A sorting domain-containing protein, partial [bacterium]